MLFSTELPWIEPISLASAVPDRNWALLYSGSLLNYSGQYSYLCVNAEETITDLARFKQKSDEGFWVGWFGYGLKNQLEKLPVDQPGFIPVEELCFTRYATIYRFDHIGKKLHVNGKNCIAPTQEMPAKPVSQVKSLQSNMSKAEYVQHVQAILDHIVAGDLYQANLTRKFFGRCESPIAGFDLFRRLCELSPAPYSAYILQDDTHIISSSPELFLQVKEEGAVISRPIKGTAPRHAQAAEDLRLRHALENSEKDKAENLMIVDLMRNDLSRVCKPGSIKTTNLFEMTSHPHIHHLSSTISGYKREDVDALDVVAASFPPGSMTGAPKIKAMQLCSELEKHARGIYSGALGWIHNNCTMELSVVIRTIIARGNCFEFQVGGGIVVDSTPQAEYEETLVKAKSLAVALGIPLERLREL